ncbi:MAG: LacI family DNA-binding transcriptional regulator [Erysipelotrichaceae bacterium]|nr:LacI family DNA-binding transcriptional regulator [Erysipelotrichaceae bacterium]
MTTIKDVAKEAGLAVGTVSRVLNNRGYISDQTREKVYKAMEKLNYQPNEVARALSRQKSTLIGVIVPLVNHPYFSNSIDNIERTAIEYGYNIILLNSDGLAEKEYDYLEFCRRNHVAGIIIYYGSLDGSKFSDIGIPIISIERHMQECTANIECDNIGGGRLGAQHLIDQGCSHLLFINGFVDQDDTSGHRRQGFEEACQAAGVSYDIVELVQSDYRVPENLSEIEKIIDSEDIDGVFSSSDMIAARVYRLLKEKGYRVPEEVKLVGFDDSNVAEFMVPGLTSVHQPVDKMAQLAVNYIIDIQNDRVVPKRSILPVSLTVRESTENY